MTSDYNLLEQELRKEKIKLERELHMHNVRRLCAKKDHLVNQVVQRKQIETLSKQVAELEATISPLYCPQYAVKDSEIMEYLVYLLEMKDFFTRQVATKKERVKELNYQMNIQFKELCAITRKQAKLAKEKSKESPEFVRLENMCNKLEQMNKQIGTMKQENKEIMENIIVMTKFQRQFKTMEREFRHKIDFLKSRQQELLEKAVSSYEEKEELMAKERVFENRRFQDLRKTAINETALNLCLNSKEKNDEFCKLQAMARLDKRLDEASDMVEVGVTGLESSMKKMQTLHSAISLAAGRDTPENIEESFRTNEDNIFKTFSYLEEIFKDMDRLQNEMKSLKRGNELQKKSMCSTDRKLRLEIQLNQDIVDKNSDEVSESAKLTDDARHELNSILDSIKSLYKVYYKEHALDLEQTPIDEGNVLDYVQEMEKQLLDNLIFFEYMKMKEASDKRKSLVLEEEKDEDIEEVVKKIEQEGIIQPRTLLSKTELQSLMELESEKSFLGFEALKERAVSAATEVLSEVSTDEGDESK